MPHISITSKIAATRSYGAHIFYSGSTSVEREAVVAEVIKETGAKLVPPYDHPDIILGQGTAALELEQQAKEIVLRRNSEPNEVDGVASPSHRHALDSGYVSAAKAELKGQTKANLDKSPGQLDAVITPLGGGGLLSGTATALAPTPTLVFGAEPSISGADDGKRGLAATPPTRVTSVSSLTIADGLRTPVGEIPWSVISDREKVEGVYAVTEDNIKRAMRLVLERMKIVVEPSAVVGLAVCLWDEDFRGWVERVGGEEGWDVGVVFSGGNTTIDAICALFGKE